MPTPCHDLRLKPDKGCHDRDIIKILFYFGHILSCFSQCDCSADSANAFWSTASDINPQYRWYRATPGSLAQRIYGYQKGNEAFTGRSAGFQRALRYEDKGGVVSLIVRPVYNF